MADVTGVATALSASWDRQSADYLSCEDLQRMFGCGVSKARLMMQQLPSVHIGRKLYVLRSDLDEYLRENGGITCAWPKRKGR